MPHLSGRKDLKFVGESIGEESRDGASEPDGVGVRNNFQLDDG